MAHARVEGGRVQVGEAVLAQRQPRPLGPTARRAGPGRASRPRSRPATRPRGCRPWLPAPRPPPPPAPTAVEMLNVPRTSPPVPQVSIVPAGACDRVGPRAHGPHEARQLARRLAASVHAHEHAAQLCRRDLAVEHGGHEGLGRLGRERLAGRDRAQGVADGLGSGSGTGVRASSGVGSQCPHATRATRT